MSSSAPARDVVRVGHDAKTGDAAPRASVAIGFGSPSEASGVSRLDLNDILIKHPQATFLMRVSGQAMHEAGIDSGDLVLVDRAITPGHGHVVIAVIDDEFTCRRLSKQVGSMCLEATDPATASVDLRDGEDQQLWGVVTHVVKPMPV